MALAVGIYNDGAITLASTMRKLDLEVGTHARKRFAEMDVERITNVQRKADAATNEARIKRRQQRLHLDEAQEQAEGFPYAAGAN